MFLNPIHINATTIPDAWHQCLYNCLDHGNEFVIDEGSYQGQKRLELDYITVHIKKPDTLPLIPKISERYSIPDPVAENYLDSYILYLMTDQKDENEAYSYGSRLCYVSLVSELLFYKDSQIKKHIKDTHFNQIDEIVWTYKNKGHRNNQMVLQIAQPSDLILYDPPCLRHIFVRIQSNKLHFFPFFRSNDLWGGFPANLAGIEILKQYMASEIGVENGEIIYSCSGLHLYDYVWESAKILRGK